MKKQGVEFKKNKSGKGLPFTVLHCAKNSEGFTLIEVLVYLGLFAILMTGMVTTAFSVFESSDRDQTRVLMQGEGDFLVGKINWTLTGVRAINSPTGSLLSVNKWINPTVATTVEITLLGTDMIIRDGGSPQTMLNNSNVSISNLVFTRNNAGTNQENIQTSFTITGRMLNGMSVSQDFSTVKYMRK
jgi:type II secretory pathway pseudopilin PulG